MTENFMEGFEKVAISIGTLERSKNLALKKIQELRKVKPRKFVDLSKKIFQAGAFDLGILKRRDALLKLSKK